MNAIRILPALALLAASAGSVHAAELRPVQARTISLGSGSALAYYTVDRDGYHVVATLDGDSGAAPVQVRVTLAPGERVTLSAPGTVGQASDIVEISREDGHLLVRHPQASE